MRNPVLTSILLLSLVGAPCATACLQQDESKAAAGILWHDDLEETMALSKADGRPVMAYFTFNACVWCHKLEDDTFSDESVIDFSRKFHWVKINRDVTPDLCKYFNMSSYPSLMVLGDNKEKVYRFSGYKLPAAFLPELEEGLERYDLYIAGKPWDIPNPRPEHITDATEVVTIKAPSDAVPAGMTFLNGELWVGQIGNLYKVDAKSGKVLKTIVLNRSVMDLCNDGELIYAVTSGWTAGKPIYVIDPDAGKVLREIVTEANKANGSYGAKGIEFVNGRLYILEGMRGKIQIINPDSGEIEGSLQTSETWVSGLALHGDYFVTGGREQLIVLDSKTGKRVKSIPMNYRLRSVGVSNGNDTAIHLMEQPVFGYDTQHKRVQIWPTNTKIHVIKWPNVDSP